MIACRYGASCYNRQPKHLMRFWHPDHLQLEGRQRQACKWGAGCFRRSVGHLDRYVHPGDNHYRKGLVFFSAKQTPQFETMDQLFKYFDPDESGYLSKEDFQELLAALCEMKLRGDASDLDATWEAAGGNASGFLNFARVAEWASGSDIALPLGLDTLGEKKPCRFKRGSSGWTCPCEAFEPAEHNLCTCGHKASAHRADISFSAAEKDLSRGLNWLEGASGLVPVEDADLIGAMQELFNKTHKTTDNWTRDRGCKIHGRGHPDCSWHCIRTNGNPVPTGFSIKKVLRNQNKDLWNHYAITKRQVLADLEQDRSLYEAMPVMSGGCDLEGEPLSFDECNEWRLFHGTSWPACEGISATNFRLSLSGTGATWKKPGAEKGSPLYGFGIYLAESVTKSDEYAGTPPSPDDGLNCMLVCRAIGGQSNLCETNEIDKAQLKSDVFNGSYHSVFGDRVKKLGKPYREIVLYDKDQIFPEFVVLYERTFG